MTTYWTAYDAEQRRYLWKRRAREWGKLLAACVVARLYQSQGDTA